MQQGGETMFSIDSICSGTGSVQGKDTPSLTFTDAVYLVRISLLTNAWSLWGVAKVNCHSWSRLRLV
jgi:hypothetical protein